MPFRWKALAAAILLVIGLWTGINYLQSNKVDSDKDKTVATKQTKAPTEKIPVKPIEQKENTTTPFITTTNNKTSPKALQNVYDNTGKKQPQPQQNVIVKNIQPVNKTEMNIIQKKPVEKKDEVKKEDVAIVPTKT